MKSSDGRMQRLSQERPMNTQLKTAIIAAALLVSAGVPIAQAMSGDTVLDELRKSGSIVTTRGILGR